MAVVCSSSVEILERHCIWLLSIVVVVVVVEQTSETQLQQEQTSNQHHCFVLHKWTINWLFLTSKEHFHIKRSVARFLCDRWASCLHFFISSVTKVAYKPVTSTGRETPYFLLTSGLEHGPWRHAAANKWH